MNWKGELMQMLTFAAAPAIGALGVLWAIRSKGLERLDRRGFLVLVVALYALTRIGTHLVVFHLFRFEGTDDLLRVWAPMGRAVLAGGHPGAYVDNLYGPLLPFVMAAGLALSGGRYAPGTDVPFLAADALSLWLLLRIARRRFPEITARRLVLAVALSPLLWLGVTVLSQDEALVAFFLLLALDLSERGRPFLLAATVALGTLSTKALFPLWALPILLAGATGRRSAAVRVGGAAALTAVGLGAALLLGWSPPHRLDERPFVYGSSSWFLVLPDGRVSGGVYRTGIAVTALLCGAAAFAATRRREGETASDSAARGVVAVQAAYFLASPFTIPLHLVHGLPFLAWQVLREGAAERATTLAGTVLLAGFAAWQIPSLSIEAAWWSGIPLVLALFAAHWAWTGWRAVAAPWPAVSAAERTDR